MGKDVRRWDTPSKVNGSAIFGTDVELRMLYGTVKHCNYCGGKIKNVDDSKTKEIPGVIAVIPLEDQVIVVADSTWTAMRGAEKLKNGYHRRR